MATGAGQAEWEQAHGKEKVKVCLDLDRPSHGRSLASELNRGLIEVRDSCTRACARTFLQCVNYVLYSRVRNFLLQVIEHK
jgi:hypothetical protein